MTKFMMEICKFPVTKCTVSADRKTIKITA